MKRLSNSRQVLDRGGERSAAPLSHVAQIFQSAVAAHALPAQSKKTLRSVYDIHPFLILATGDSR
jgi:hypothetical protein